MAVLLPSWREPVWLSREWCPTGQGTVTTDQGSRIWCTSWGDCGCVLPNEGTTGSVVASWFPFGRRWGWR